MESLKRRVDLDGGSAMIESGYHYPAINVERLRGSCQGRGDFLRAFRCQGEDSRPTAGEACSVCSRRAGGCEQVGQLWEDARTVGFVEAVVHRGANAL